MFRLILIAGMALGIGAFATEHSASDESQFNLDKDLVQSIYKEAVTEAKIETKRGASRLRVKTEFSYLTPTAITLSNQYFDVEYGEGFSGLPGVNLSVSQSIINWKSLSVSLLGTVGFSRKEALSIVRTKSGTPFKDMIQLSRIPLIAGFRTDLNFSETAVIRPYLETSVGVQWLYQSGKLDKALEQGFWIPFYQVGLGINLFGGGNTNDWFGGVDVGGAIQRSFASTQVTNSWALALGVTLYL